MLLFSLPEDKLLKPLQSSIHITDIQKPIIQKYLTSTYYTIRLSRRYKNKCQTILFVFLPIEGNKYKTLNYTSRAL